MSQSADLCSAEGNAPLLSDAIAICIQIQLHSQKSMSSAVRCLLSLSSTSLRTAGRLAAEIHFLSESIKRVLRSYTCVTEDAYFIRRKLLLMRLRTLFSAVGISVGICCLFPIIIESICYIFKILDLYLKDVLKHYLF